jgi:CheY-like chemotaxis protein
MAERILLCIEPDSATVTAVRNALSPYGFRVENIPNGEEALEWGKSHTPELIILSVEPRKVGYAICNKLKKSPALRNVPLILISAEETLATFEQHKKLKSRADEYLLKPLDIGQLFSKLDKLVDLGSALEEIEEADSGDIMLADDDDVAEGGDGEGQGQSLAPERSQHGDTSEQRVTEGEASPFTGERFDPETQAAFAALEAGHPPETMPASGASGDMVDLRSLWSEEDLPATLGWEQPMKFERPGNDRGNDAATFTGGDPTGTDRHRDPFFGHDAGASALPSEDALDMSAQDDARVQELESHAAALQSRIESLEHERQTMRKEMDEARERYNQTASFSKEREFLGLREIINKKEKDILDLRDDVDAKERQMLDHKDKIRELERARRDLEEKTLGFEKSLVAANEKVAELLMDKDKSVEREKGLKARLDDAHEEIRKSHDEVEGLRKRVSQDEMRSRGELERVRGELETRLVEMDEVHRRELAKNADERAALDAEAEVARQAEAMRVDSAHRAEVEGLQRRLAEEQASSAERLGVEVQRLRRDQEKTVASLRDEQAAQLASERQAYEALTEAKERDHRNEILAMRRHQEEELAGAEDRRQRDITEQEQRRISELEMAEARRRAELQSRDEEQHARITEIERRHLTEKSELSERHRAEYDQALGRAARAEGELAARIQEIEQAYRRLAGLEADLDAARAELGDREVRLSQSRDRIAELESKVSDYEDQIVRAFQRIRSDEKTTEKTRRALSVALALMDERSTAAGSATTATMRVVEDADLKT